ncbi:MAG: hypothetical protein ACJZ8F_04345 [Candidatus Pelagibacter sp.]
MLNFFKKFFIFFWNTYSRINLKIYLKKNIKIKKKIFKKLNILIIKPFNYSDLYSPNISNKIDTIKSSKYRMGPISIILDFKTKIIISDYSNNKKIYLKKLSEKINGKKYKYYKFLYNHKINFKKFDFSKFDWIISIKDSVPTNIIKQNPDILWTLMFEDHREVNYLKYKIFGSKKYDLTLDTTQGFTPYDIFKNSKSVNFPYSFASNSVANKLKIKRKKKKQILLEIYQPKKLSFKKIKNIKVFASDSSLKIYDHLKRLAKTKYFYCPIYELPRWGNSIIEAAAFDCLIIGNPNCFWNSLLIQKECIAKSHDDGLKIIEKFEKNNKLYIKVLENQKKIFNLINYYRPLYLISKITKKDFLNKKISKIF